MREKKRASEMRVRRERRRISEREDKKEEEREYWIERRDRWDIRGI